MYLICIKLKLHKYIYLNIFVIFYIFSIRVKTLNLSKWLLSACFILKDHFKLLALLLLTSKLQPGPTPRKRADACQTFGPFVSLEFPGLCRLRAVI